MINIRKNKGFTLAEILITLGIIGIVAAIMVPTLFSSVNDAELRTAFKKKYRDYSEAFALMKNDNGGTLEGIFSSFPVFITKVSQYVNTQQICSGNSRGNCWHNDNAFYTQSGTPQTSGNHGLVLSDGTLFSLANVNLSCPNSTDACGFFNVDVNGFKGPNTFGKDIYGIFVTKDGIAPAGTPPLSWSSGNGTTNCGAGKNGVSCAALVLRGVDY